MWLVSVCVHLNVHKCGLHPLFLLFLSCREKQKKEVERETVLVVSSPWITLSLTFADYMRSRWPSPSESESVSCSVVSDSLQTHELYSPPLSSIHGISQARILEWVAIPFSRVFFWPRDRTWASCIQADSLSSELQGSPNLFWLYEH